MREVRKAYRRAVIITILSLLFLTFICVFYLYVSHVLGI